MTLKGYVTRRILVLVPLLFGITIMIFVIVRSAPGDPVISFFGMRPGVDYDPSTIERVRHLLGLDQPLHIQYFQWLWRLLHGDFGRSFIHGVPVSQLIGRAMVNTLKIQIPSLLLAIGIAIPSGVISAVKQYSKADYAVMTSSLFFWSLPWFWFGMMMIYIFALQLGWFPTHGMAPPGTEGSLIDQIRHAILPIVVLGTSSAGFMARLVRSSMLEVLRQDYISVARSKGLTEKIVIYRHALRNALLPLVTVIGLYVGLLFGGAAVTETVFAWPGCGSLIVTSARWRDYPTVMGITIIVTISVLISVLITDIAYAYLDPRVRY
jgi:peptide/nickel transport system permease protein